MEGGLLPLALAVVALVIALAAFALPVRLLAKERSARALLAEQVKALASKAPVEQELRAQAAAVEALAQRLGHSERRIEQLHKQMAQLRLAQERLDRVAEPQSANYAQAVKLARKGASADELMELCGLTRGEAELVAMMNTLRGGG